MSYDSEHILIKRRRRERRWRNRPRPFLRLAQVLAAVLIAVILANALVVGSAVGAVAGVYAYFAQDLPDPSTIETKQEEFETVRIYDRTGDHLLYESYDPRPFRGDRTFVPLEQICLRARMEAVSQSQSGQIAVSNNGGFDETVNAFRSVRIAFHIEQCPEPS